MDSWQEKEKVLDFKIDGNQEAFAAAQTQS